MNQFFLSLLGLLAQGLLPNDYAKCGNQPGIAGSRSIPGSDVSYYSMDDTEESPNVVGSPDKNSPNPICIVGGGFAGLSMATLLQSKGYNVELFEAKSFYGGKAQTVRTENGTYMLEKGAAYTTKFASHLLSYMDKYKMEMIPFDITQHELYDPLSGKRYPSPPVDENEVTEAIRRYREERKKYPDSIFETGYPNLHKYKEQYPELLLSIEDWLAVKNLSILVPYFTNAITTEGCGDLKDVPALYSLKFVTYEEAFYLLFVRSPVLVWKEGIDVLMHRVAKDVKKKYLNHKLLKVERLEEGLQRLHLEVTPKDQEGVYPYVLEKMCHKTILAFPPLLGNLVKIMPDLSHHDRKVLQDVKIYKYASGGSLIPKLAQNAVYTGVVKGVPVILPNETVVEIPEFYPPPGDGGTHLLAKCGKGDFKDAFQTLSWIYGEYDSPASEDDLIYMQKKRDLLLDSMVGPGNYKNLFFEGWEYYPHVTIEALKKDFYKHFNRLQGKQGIYYASTVLTFESLNTVAEMTGDLAKRYF